MVATNSPDGDAGTPHPTDTPAVPGEPGAVPSETPPGATPPPAGSSPTPEDTGTETPAPDDTGVPTVPGPQTPPPTTDPFFRPSTSIIAQCADTTLRGADTSAARKLEKAELLAALKDVILPSHNYDELAKLQEYKDQSTKSFENREPLQLAMNEFPPDVTDLPGEAFVATFSQEQLASWSNVVDLVGQRFVDKQWEREYDNDDCLESATPPAACWTTFVENLGKSVFRRPLEADEAGRIATLAASAGDRGEGVYRALVRLLLSPQFMYIFEPGETAAEDAGRVHLTQYEVANRLAFALTGRAPDAELSQAAADGALDDLDVIRGHAGRLVRSDAAKEKLLRFFRDWVHIDRIPEPNLAWGNWAMVPDNGLFTANRLDQNLREEVEDYIRFVVWQEEGTYADLLTRPIAMVKEERMQAVYQTASYNTDGQPVDAPGYPGLFTRAGLLASQGAATNPIRRAMNIKSQALCQTIPSPDFSVVAARQDGIEELDPLMMPNHQIVTGLTSPDACYACHQYINPVGYVFETYTPLGQRSDIQPVVRNINDPNEWPRDYPIPNLPDGVKFAAIVTHELPGPQSFVIEEGLPEVYSTPDELVSAIAQSETGPACLSVRFFRHLQRRSEAVTDACGIADGYYAFREKPILDSFVDSVVNEDIFWRQQ